jgi:hypothetical protein
MTRRRPSRDSANTRRSHGERLKDEVYRQMFRLEAQRPGAERDLAIALLRAWMIAQSIPERRAEREWLKKISPICLQMIEAALKANNAAVHCPK